MPIDDMGKVPMIWEKWLCSETMQHANVSKKMNIIIYITCLCIPRISSAVYKKKQYFKKIILVLVFK